MSKSKTSSFTIIVNEYYYYYYYCYHPGDGKDNGYKITLEPLQAYHQWP